MAEEEAAKFICTSCNSKCELVCRYYGGNLHMACPWNSTITGWKRISKEVVIPPEPEEEKEDESPIKVKIVGV